jgi:nitrate/nitrite transport system ATP-binding protein
MRDIKEDQAMSFIELRNAAKHFGPENRPESHVLRDINLKVEEGEFVAIIGFSGSGKSTLINLLAGLLDPDAGEALFKGKPITGPSPDRGLVFQNYSLLPWLTVYGNVALGVDQVFKHWSRKKRDEHIRRFIDMVNLTPALHKRPRELSGGMRQRVAVARTLAMDPTVLLLDEPLGALDALTPGELQQEIAGIWEQQRKTAVLITNSVDEGLILADRIIPLTLGPGATLGPEFVVDLPRPRDASALNKNPEYVRLRTEITDYLIEIGQMKETRGDDVIVDFPDLQPLDPDERKTYAWVR